MSTIGYEHHPIRAARQPHRVSDRDRDVHADSGTPSIRYEPRAGAAEHGDSPTALWMSWKILAPVELSPL
jgi:hypothetical protein